MTPLHRTAFIFVIFNLIVIPLLAWPLKPIFAYLYAESSYWPGIVLSSAFIIFVFGVHIALSVRAYRIDRKAILTWLMIGWTVLTIISGILLSAVGPWAMVRSGVLAIQFWIGV